MRRNVRIYGRGGVEVEVESHPHGVFLRTYPDRPALMTPETARHLAFSLTQAASESEEAGWTETP